MAALIYVFSFRFQAFLDSLSRRRQFEITLLTAVSRHLSNMGGRFGRMIRNFNLENRAFREISKEKPTAAPRHDADGSAAAAGPSGERPGAAVNRLSAGFSGSVRADLRVLRADNSSFLFYFLVCFSG